MTPAVRAASERGVQPEDEVFALRLGSDGRNEVVEWAADWPEDRIGRTLGHLEHWHEVEMSPVAGSLWEIAVVRADLDAIAARWSDEDGRMARYIETAVLTAYLRGPSS